VHSLRCYSCYNRRCSQPTLKIARHWSSRVTRRIIETLMLEFIVAGSFLTSDTYNERNNIWKKIVTKRFFPTKGNIRGPTGSALDHISQPPEFESRREHIWRVFHLWLRFITFGGRSAHLAYRVHKVAVKHQSNLQNKHPNNVTNRIIQESHRSSFFFCYLRLTFSFRISLWSGLDIQTWIGVRLRRRGFYTKSTVYFRYFRAVSGYKERSLDLIR